MTARSTALITILCLSSSFVTLVNTESTDYSTDIEKESSPSLIYKVDAKTGQFPWTITFKTIYHCMGVLIHPQWVVTAANCLEETTDPSYYELQLDHPDSTGAGKMQVRKASALFPYPLYKNPEGRRGKDFSHNIALLKVEMPFVTKNFLPVKTAALESEDSEKKICTIVGLVWETSQPNEKTLQLQFTRVRAYNFEDCLYKFKDFKQYTGMWHTLCTRGIGEQSKVGCSGNPGGPLICPSNTDESQNSTNSTEVGLELVGISSWNEEGLYCGTTSRYTDVGRFRNWISTMMGEKRSTFDKGLKQVNVSSCSNAMYMPCSTRNPPTFTLICQVGLFMSSKFSH